ncbi:MAG: hypothetical protein NTW17_00470 [Candidatus Pacearchaeota archaeon]|nr:hypothetical protein [Candidatus Pacearchaeota archaeon]
MGRHQSYILNRVNLGRANTDYLQGYVDSFDETKGFFGRLFYKIRGEPPKIAACRKILSERKDLTERLTPS